MNNQRVIISLSFFVLALGCFGVSVWILITNIQMLDTADLLIGFIALYSLLTIGFLMNAISFFGMKSMDLALIWNIANVVMALIFAPIYFATFGSGMSEFALISVLSLASSLLLCCIAYMTYPWGETFENKVIPSLKKSLEELDSLYKEVMVKLDQENGTLKQLTEDVDSIIQDLKTRLKSAQSGQKIKSSNMRKMYGLDRRTAGKAESVLNKVRQHLNQEVGNLLSRIHAYDDDLEEISGRFFTASEKNILNVINSNKNGGPFFDE